PNASEGLAEQLALAHVLVDAHARAERQVDIAARVDPAAVGRQRVPPRNDFALRVHHADAGGEPADAAFADAEEAVAVDGNIQGPAPIVPDRQELAIGRNDLEAVVVAIARGHRAVRVD